MSSGSPKTSATASSIQHYYVTHQGRCGAAGLLGLLAVTAGLGFYSYLRAYYRTVVGDTWLPSLFFTGALVFGVSGAIGAGMNFALADHPKDLSATSLQTLNTLLQNLNWAALCVGLALLYLALGVLIRRANVAPRWMSWVCWLLTALSLSFFLAFIPFVLTPVWALVVGIRMSWSGPAVGER